MRSILILGVIALMGCAADTSPPDDSICDVVCERYREPDCPAHLGGDDCESICQVHRARVRQESPACVGLVDDVYDCQSLWGCEMSERCWPARQRAMDCAIGPP